MIHYKEWAAAHKMYDAVTFLDGLVQLRIAEGWVTAGDVTLTKRRDRTGGYSYKAERPLAKEE